MEAVERKVIQLETNLDNMKERIRQEQERTDKRLDNVEKDITEIKVVLERTDTNVAGIAKTAEETRTDIKKAKTWFIVTIVGFFLTIIGSVIVMVLT